MAFISIFTLILLAFNLAPFAKASAPALAGTIGVGTEPTLVAFDSGKGEYFVVDSRSNSVVVVSDSSDSVVANVTIPSATRISGLIVSPSGRVIVSYTSFHGGVTSAYVAAISDSSNEIVTLNKLGLLCISCAASDLRMDFDGDSGNIVVSIGANGTVDFVDPGTLSVESKVTLNAATEGICSLALSDKVFVAEPSIGNVSVISDKTLKIVANISLGSTDVPQLLTCDTSGEVFVTGGGRSYVRVISGSSNSVVATITGATYGDANSGAVYVSDASALFTANGRQVDVISDKSNSILGTVNLGNLAASFGAYDDKKVEVAFTDYYDNVLILIALSGSSTTTSASSSATASSSSAVTESTANTPSTSTTAALSSSSTVSGGGGGIPEFPYALQAAVLFVFVLVISYLFVRSRRPPRGRPGN